MLKPNDHDGNFNFQTYNPFESFDRVEELWKMMLEKSQHSYFTSWGWISTWIKSLPAESGVSLIVGSRNDTPALAFLIGLPIGAIAIWPKMLTPVEISGNGSMLIAAGILVGFGTRLANGCTSGHGVCGLPRFSIRSIDRKSVV